MERSQGQLEVQATGEVTQEVVEETIGMEGRVVTMVIGEVLKVPIGTE